MDAIPAAPPSADILVAPGRTVTPLTFRRALLRIGRGYGIAGDAGRAGLCARLGRASDQPLPDDLPPWLWVDARRILGIPEPVAPRPRDEGRRERSRSTVVDAAGALVDLDEVLDAIPLDEHLVDFLAESASSVYDDTRRMRWLRVATAHTSYLYENGLSDLVGASVLQAIAELAKRHVRMAVLDRYVKSHQPAKVGQQVAALTADERAAWAALAALPIFRDATHFGRGEAAVARDRTSRSQRVVVQQIIGVAALLGGHPAVRRLVDRAVAGVPATSASEPSIDWRSTLAQHVRDHELSWEWDRTGSDHDPTSC